MFLKWLGPQLEELLTVNKTLCREINATTGDFQRLDKTPISLAFLINFILITVILR
jgi:hypothetical protein